ncbi:hypothetical protein V1523DRAFT_445523 [Lipomyces doorenjongii]
MVKVASYSRESESDSSPPFIGSPKRGRSFAYQPFSSSVCPVLDLFFWKILIIVITVGDSESAADTAASLIDTPESPIHAVVRGRYNPYFGDEAFKNPKIQRRAPISHISRSSGNRTVHFEDGNERKWV